VVGVVDLGQRDDNGSEGGWRIEEAGTYRLNMSETISISVSAAAIFSAEEGCGRAPKPNIDISGELLRLSSSCI